MCADHTAQSGQQETPGLGSVESLEETEVAAVVRICYPTSRHGAIYLVSLLNTLCVLSTGLGAESTQTESLLLGTLQAKRLLPLKCIDK